VATDMLKEMMGLRVGSLTSLGTGDDAVDNSEGIVLLEDVSNAIDDAN